MNDERRSVVDQMTEIDRQSSIRGREETTGTYTRVGLHLGLGGRGNILATGLNETPNKLDPSSMCVSQSKKFDDSA